MKIVKQGFYIHDWVQQTKVEVSTWSCLKEIFFKINYHVYRTGNIDQSRQVIQTVDVWLVRIIYRQVISEKSLTSVTDYSKLKVCETLTQNTLQ